MSSTEFNPEWREKKAAVFSVEKCSTSGKTIPVTLWGKPYRVYSNANLSIYSAQECNGACPFCVEKLRAESRGRTLSGQKSREGEDTTYFRNLQEALEALKPLNVSVSITGGEPSKDPRLPRILSCIKEKGMRKRTMTTNGSGLLDEREGKRVIDWVLASGLQHLNISWAHPNRVTNMGLMCLSECLTTSDLSWIAQKARMSGCRVRLSCALLKGVTESIEEICDYLEFARGLGVDNVVFRQLMQTDEQGLQTAGMRYSDAHRVSLGELFERIAETPGFTFQEQVLGYYYYVEIFKYKGVDVVFEEADLRAIENQKRLNPDLIYEFVFHPNARLCSTWQQWDGQLMPEREIQGGLRDAA